MEQLLQDFLKLGGFAALVTVLIAFGKRFGIITDGTSGNWNIGLNLFGLVLFFVAQVVHLDVAGADSLLGIIATILTAILGLLGQTTLTKGLYASAKSANIPLVGYSLTK